MNTYARGLIGRDVKPPRSNTPMRRNRLKPTRSRWLFPALVVVTSLGIIVAGIREEKP